MKLRLQVCAALLTLLFSISANASVYEVLTVKVPPQNRSVFIRIDKKIWGPWLKQFPFYRSKKILYNQNKPDELIIWIEWRSLKDLQSINKKDVDTMTDKFNAATNNRYKEIDSQFYVNIPLMSTSTATGYGMFKGNGQVWKAPKV